MSVDCLELLEMVASGEARVIRDVRELARCLEHDGPGEVTAMHPRADADSMPSDPAGWVAAEVLEYWRSWRHDDRSWP